MAAANATQSNIAPTVIVSPDLGADGWQAIRRLLIAVRHSERLMRAWFASGSPGHATADELAVAARDVRLLLPDV